MEGKKQIVIVDYGLGNIHSVQHACYHLGISASLSFNKQEIMKSNALILPGVGAFGDAVDNLKKLDLIEPIKEFVASGKPVLGICLGMQLLLEGSEESGGCIGLGIIKGTIKKFPSEFGGIKNKIPQIAWNAVYPPATDAWEQTPLSTIKHGELMYFVHSYYAQPINEKNILSQTTYNNFQYCSSVIQDKVYATQFHPEKSSSNGLQILKNFHNLI